MNRSGAASQLAVGVQGNAGSISVPSAASADGGDSTEFTTSIPHGYSSGDAVTLSGFSVSAYNVTNESITTVSDSTHFTVEISYDDNVSGLVTGGESIFSSEAAATDRILLTSGSPKKTFEQIQEEALTGNVGRGAPEQGLATSTDTLDCTVPFTLKDGDDFISADALIAAFMGENNYSSPWNEIVFNDLSVYALTLAYIFGTATAGRLKVFTGAIPTSMELSCELSGKLSASFDYVGYDAGDTDGTNSKSDIDSIPHIGHTNAMGHYMEFFLTDDLSDSLANSDRLKINSFTLTTDIPRDDDSYSTPDASHSDAQKIITPIVDGRRDVSLDFEVPRYESTRYEDWKDNHTELQGKIKLTDSTRTINILMPNIHISDPDIPLDGAGSLTQSVSATLGRNDNTGDNMALTGSSDTVNNEFAIEIDTSSGDGNGRTGSII